MGNIILIVWTALTVIVMLFLFDRFLHPNIKGISPVDLKDYTSISIYLIGFCLIFKTIVFFLKKNFNKSALKK